MQAIFVPVDHRHNGMGGHVRSYVYENAVIGSQWFCSRALPTVERAVFPRSSRFAQIQQIIREIRVLPADLPGWQNPVSVQYTGFSMVFHDAVRMNITRRAEMGHFCEKLRNSRKSAGNRSA